MAHSLRSATGLDEERLAHELKKWWPARIGAGRATAAAVKRLLAGDPSPGDRNSQGNGAAMRVAPLAIAFAAIDESMLDAVLTTGRITHANPEAIAGAEILTRALHLTLHEQPLHIDKLLPHTSQDLPRWHSLLKQAFQLAQNDDEGLQKIGTTGWVFHTVPSALFLFSRWPDDLNQGLTVLYKNGVDTDTIGALIGAKRGLRAFDGFPWPDLQGAAVLLSAAKRLSTLNLP